MNMSKILTSTALILVLTTNSYAGTKAVCIGGQVGLPVMTRIVELNDPYMTVSPPGTGQALKDIFKKRTVFTRKAGGVRAKNAVWRYTKTSNGAILEHLSFGDIYTCS